jgi:hypothetical protein
MSYLDDWSQQNARYRRAVRGSAKTPEDHNGSASFPVKLGQTQIVVAEFDQARLLVGRLPAAAAEVMLRRPEYLLRMSTSPCDAGDICVDVFRKPQSSVPTAPEQRWKISSSTGLPDAVLLRPTAVGSPANTGWTIVHYGTFTSQSDVLLPQTIVLGDGTGAQSLQLVSFKPNPGFDPTSFDQEVAQ